MAAPVKEIEVRWRLKEVETEWRVQRFPPTAAVITLTGLVRGGDYEGQARSLGPAGETSAWVPIDFVVAAESSTPVDRLTLDLDIEAGLVVVDCTLSKFRLTLNENVANWQFANVPQATSITVEIEQWPPGGYTVAWPASVVPVSGQAHVMTPTAGAIDFVTLSTTDGGRTWYQTVGQPAPSGDGGGVFALVLTPNPATGTATTNGVAASAPSVAITAVPANGAAPIAFAWTRIDTNGGADFAVTPGSPSTFSAPAGTTAFAGTQVWRCTATDAHQAVASATATVTLNRSVVGAGSVSILPNPAAAEDTHEPAVTVTASIAGGSGARTIAWTRVDANGGPDFLLSYPTGASTTFSLPYGIRPVTREQTWRCTVTDDTGPVFGDVTVTLERTGGVAA